jgi:hypothetical protein
LMATMVFLVMICTHETGIWSPYSILQYQTHTAITIRYWKI